MRSHSIRDILGGDYPLDVKRSLIEAVGEFKNVVYFDLFADILSREDVPFLLQKSALYALGIMGDKKALPLLLSYLDHPNAHLRMRAVEAMGNLGQADTGELIRQKLADKNKFVRQAAILALGRIKSAKYIPYLENFLASSDPYHKRSAIISLAILEDTRIIPELIRFLQTPQPYEVKRQALQALGVLGKEDEFKAILLLLKNFPFNLKVEAALALREILERQEIRKVDPALILEHSFSPSWRLRRLIMEIAGFFKDDSVKKRLLEVIKFDRSDLVKSAAILSMKNFRDPEVRGVLAAELKNDVSLIRESAVITLGKIGTVKDLDRIRKNLKDEDLLIREEAAHAIMNILKNEVEKNI